MLIWQFKTKHFIVRMSCDYDQDMVDLSWDDTGEVREKLASGEWAVYTFHAEVIERSTGNTIGEDYLGGSIYGDPEDFRDHVGLAEKGRKDGRNYSSYFTDMIREAIKEARKNYTVPRPTLRGPDDGLKLILVSYDNGDNLDLFVWATDRAQALDIWAAHYAWDEAPREARTFVVPTTQSDKPTALEWTTAVKELA